MEENLTSFVGIDWAYSKSSRKKFLAVLFDKMTCENNIFNEGQTIKSKFPQWRVNTGKLINYSQKCEKVLNGCDEIKAISQGDGLKNAPCFNVSNDTNSKEKVIIGEYFSCGCFSSVSIVKNACASYTLYSVLGVYEGMALNLIDFKFYSDNSRQVNQNGYLSDILIHWKSFRLSNIKDTNFDILSFIQELLSYEVKDKNSILTKNRLSNKFLEYLGEYYITRYDYRFDFFCKYELQALKFRDVYSGASRILHENLVKDRYSKKIYTGWSAWNRKNHYVYTRYYQKQVEVLDHWLEDLYFDYVNFDGKVWRLEYEFGSDFTVKARGKHFLVDEFVDHSLENMALEYVWLKAPKGWFSAPKSESPSFKDRSLVSQTRSLHMYWSIWKSLLDSGYNPYHYLDFWLTKKGYKVKDLDKLKKEALWKEKELEILNYKFETYKLQKKELYEKIYKNQLWIEL